MSSNTWSPGSQPVDLAPALAALVARRPDLGLRVEWAGALPSTMDAVAAAAEAGAPAGLVVGAETQTAGRGRRGRTWVSPFGAGLYFSYLARPRRDAGLLTLAAGVAVRAGIAQATGLAADLKWPNDLLVGSRKLAGLLAEGAHVGTPHAAVTLGVGINVRPASMPGDVVSRATCLDLALGRAVNRSQVLAAVLEQLADTFAALAAGEGGAILQAWRDASPSSAGTRVQWHDRGTTLGGVTAGLDDAGALLVQTARGLERLIAGEVAWDL